MVFLWIFVSPSGIPFTKTKVAGKEAPRKRKQEWEFSLIDETTDPSESAMRDLYIAMSEGVTVTSLIDLRIRNLGGEIFSRIVSSF
jgi:hypothetical protein